MAYDLRPVLEKIRDHIRKSGYVKTAQIGEPFRPPGDFHGAVFYGAPWTIYETTLTTPRERRDVIIRLYRRAVVDDEEKAELEFGRTLAELTQSLWKDFQFDDSSEVQWGSPTDFEIQPGYQSVGRETGGVEILYRIADLTLPILVDDSFTFGPA